MKKRNWRRLSIVVVFILVTEMATAQTRAAVLNADQVRNQAGNVRQFKELLASPDASIRYAAVSEMLKSNDNGLRVLAFDMAFQSAESSIRALALKERILSMRLLMIEPESENVASQLVDKRLSRIAIPLGTIDYSRGFADVNAQSVLTNGNGLRGYVSVAGEVVSIDVRGVTTPVSVIGRFRLSDGGKLVGGIQWTLGASVGNFPAFIFVN